MIQEMDLNNHSLDWLGLQLEAYDVEPCFIFSYWLTHTSIYAYNQKWGISSFDCLASWRSAGSGVCAATQMCVCKCVWQGAVASATNCPSRLLALLLRATKWHGWPLAGRLLAHQDTAHKEEALRWRRGGRDDLMEGWRWSLLTAPRGVPPISLLSLCPDGQTEALPPWSQRKAFYYITSLTSTEAD